MYRGRAKSEEEVPMENTEVWSCTKEDCNGWMRDNFAFEHMPTCRLCESPMTRSTKMLALLENSNGKSIKKGANS